MTVEDLHEQLLHLLAYKESRVRIGRACVTHQLLPELVQYCHPDSGVSHQSCWCLEQAFLLHQRQCYPVLPAIIDLYSMDINHSGMRSLGKIALIMSQKYYGKKSHELKELLTRDMREQMVAGCFDELIAARGKSANLSFMTRALCLLSSEFDWIKEELPPIITSHLEENTARGYRTTGVKVLQWLKSQ